MSQDAYFDDISTKLAAALSGGFEAEDVVWTVVDALSSVIDGATGASLAAITGGAGQVIHGAITRRSGRDIATTPNPFFIWNGHEGDGNQGTKKYLKYRTIKGVSGSVIGVAGAAASQVTQVDAAGIAMHSNAVGSTAAHIVQLRAIASSYTQTVTVGRWLDLVLKMKVAKAGIRGSQLAGAAIPVGAVGIATGLAASAAKLGVQLTLTKACLVTAAELHWRAFQEQVISGGRGAIGPASRIIFELFTRRGATRILGKYDVGRFIKEPCGWMAVSDKILLI